MNSIRKSETQAGIFVILGALLTGGMVIYFSDLQERFAPRYELTILFPNAGGLVMGSLVYMAGAPIGRVTEPPAIMQDPEGVRVKVRVAINESIKIRKGSKWLIGSSGLLGDRFVEVQPGTDPQAGFIEAGATIQGQRTADIADITAQVEPLITEAKGVVVELKKIATKVNDSVLTEENSQELSSILVQLDEMMQHINQALEEGKLDVILSDVRTILDNMKKLFATAGSGVGPLYEIMADKETGDNLAAFIANLRKHGILFYSDSYQSGDGKGKQMKKRVEASAIKTPREKRQ